ncbi:hypothetical protein A3D69_03155 [Candidatus Uhrbacteria bacterium RIFCSPHIGHO2_02_FULL_54_11]|nr:MAG: hypothetical protein A3D69_03155 [Candidatus Uhrbacteria bacterium RIFCSPHIGHO2_02_FULL_54_11]
MFFRLSLFLLALASMFLFVPSVFAAGWVTQTTGTLFDLYAIDFSGNFGVATANGSSVLVTQDGGKNWSVVAAGFGSYFAVDVLNATTAVIVGTGGTIRKTTDSGATWPAQTSGTRNNLRGVDMITSMLGVAVGDGGEIVKTVNGGITWTPQTSGVSVSLKDVAMATSIVGWAVGNNGTILKTVTSGTTWTPQTSGVTSSMTTVDPISTTAAWAGTSSGTLLKTLNGGTTWTPSTMSGVTYVVDLDFYTATQGLLTTSAAIYETSNSGTTWTPMTIPALGFGGLNRVWMYAGMNAARAVGYGGTVLRYDATAPSWIAPINVVTLTTPSSDSTPTISWMPAIDGESDVSYEVSVDSGAYVNRGADASVTLDALADGSHTVNVRPVDEGANAGLVITGTFSIEASGPSVGLVTPGVAVASVAVTFQVIPTDPSGVSSCSLYVDGVLQGAMASAGGIFSRPHTFASSGTASVYAACTDGAGNTASGAVVSVAISAGAAPADTTAPSVGVLSPASATAGVAVMFSASVSDALGVASCSFYIGGVSQGGMNVSSGTASVSYTFSTAGSYAAYAQCTDASGNTGTGISTTVTVSVAASSAPVADDAPAANPATPATPATPASPTSEANIGDLIKTACAASSGLNDPCRAVYFLGSDGKRHAFPNDRAYFTWYADFSGVKTVSQSAMSSIPLGRNVTYRPGSRMVKFVTANTVYAVGRGGVLRPIASETAAAAIYGTDWNKKIDDVSDAFYGNYTFGSSVASVASFDRNAEFAGVQTISDNL